MSNSFQYDVLLITYHSDYEAANILADALRNINIAVLIRIVDSDTHGDFGNDSSRSRGLIHLIPSSDMKPKDWVFVARSTAVFLASNRFCVLSSTSRARDLQEILTEHPRILWSTHDTPANVKKLLKRIKRLVNGTELQRHESRADERKPGSSVLNSEKMFPAHNTCVWELAATSDGTRLLSASADKTVRIAKAASLRRPLSTLRGHTRAVLGVALSFDDNLVATASYDGTIRIWSLASSEFKYSMREGDPIESVAWTKGGLQIIVGTHGSDIELWDVGSRVLSRLYLGHAGPVFQVSPFPDGRHFASASSDRTIRIWNTQRGDCVSILRGHASEVNTVVLSSKRRLAISGSNDTTIKLWDVDSARCTYTLEGHTDIVSRVALSPDDRIIASASWDRTLRLWDSNSGAQLDAITLPSQVKTVLFSPAGTHVFAGCLDGTIHSYEVNVGIPHTCRQRAAGYASAKVVLVGDGGAGKTSLALRLTGKMFRRTKPTAGHRTHQLSEWRATQLLSKADGATSIDREIWLWDFAGQSDFRLMHQLFWHDASVALLVFNVATLSSFDDLTEWRNALGRPNQQHLSKFLVAAQCDRVGRSVSKSSAHTFSKQNGFSAYIETSSKTSAGCRMLREAILSAVDWSSIAWTASPEVFRRLKAAILKLQGDGIVLLESGDLAARIRNILAQKSPTSQRPTAIGSHNTDSEHTFTNKDLNTVLGLLAAQGLIWKLEFGEYILLHPEWVSIYVGAVLSKARANSAGAINAAEMYLPAFLKPFKKRLPAAEEAIVLRAMHASLLKYGVCLQVDTNEGAQLVFPSVVRCEPLTVPAFPSCVSFRFKGPTDFLFATLVVSLSHSGTVKRRSIWANAAEFTNHRGHILGLSFNQNPKRGSELELYWDESVSDDLQLVFERFVFEHLVKHAEDVTRRYRCALCPRVVVVKSSSESTSPQSPMNRMCGKCARNSCFGARGSVKIDFDVTRADVRRMVAHAAAVHQTFNVERILVGEVMVRANKVGQIFREEALPDEGLDGHIEFRDEQGRFTGKRAYLQLKSGDGHLYRRRDGTETFQIKNQKWVDVWTKQPWPVMLVIRVSDQDIRWMDVGRYLKRELRSGRSRITQILFDGSTFDGLSIIQLRDALIRRRK